jgi:hypothetical protein
MERIDRKEAIKRTALLMGGLVFAPNALGVLNGCKARPGVDWNPQYFSNAQARLVTVLADVIIPRGDTPGASDVGVPAFILAFFGASVLTGVLAARMDNTRFVGVVVGSWLGKACNAHSTDSSYRPQRLPPLFG